MGKMEECFTMNNDIYGKRMENVKNRINVKLVGNEKDYLKYTSKPRYLSYKILDNNLVAVCKSKLALKLSKPAYIGICILELSINERIQDQYLQTLIV